MPTSVGGDVYLGGATIPDGGILVIRGSVIMGEEITTNKYRYVVIDPVENESKLKFQKPIDEEKADIISASKATGEYMLAPNGKKSNLTEDKWAISRTKQFKNWFGDWELEFLILNLQDGEEIDYEKLRKAGAGIIGGKYEYSRLHNNEERARNSAGRVAVEATLLSENHKRNYPEKYSTSPKTWSGHKQNVGDLEKQLESYAKKYGYWYDPGSFDSDPEYNHVGGGSESKVFIDKYDDDYLVKVNGYDYVSMVDPLTFLDERIAIHNRVVVQRYFFKIESNSKHDTRSKVFILRSCSKILL